MEGESGGYHHCLCSGRSCTEYSKKISLKNFHAHATSLTWPEEQVLEGMCQLLLFFERLIISSISLIVIMLFRLRMSVDEAIDAYARLAKHVFSAQKWFFKDGKFKASRLEEAIATVIQDALKIGEGESRSVRMLDEEAVKWYDFISSSFITSSPHSHHSFVCAMPEGNFNSPFLFRSWSPVANQTYDCTIVEAARATSAAPTFFKAIEFGEPIRQRYIDGGFGCNNPVRHVIEEAKSLFPTRPISCVISLGTGAAGIIGLDRANVFQRLLRRSLIKALIGIATDCERRSEETARDAARSKLFQYTRLNVNQGLQRVSLAEWEKLPEVQLHTLQYLKTQSVGESVDRLVKVLRGGS